MSIGTLLLVVALLVVVLSALNVIGVPLVTALVVAVVLALVALLIRR